ncbi:hypothetical protein TD95_002117 [Thielaviopsis punctulata]|uniref:Extracellular metalloproteinase n=1 Tax=Thielaviopsis punctulata TaxID=72032 RepID=A0A0F4Z9N7_9PEZI|nr:hypothetical protein TD95_002117 [Thielaviopsis punctulata]
MKSVVAFGLLSQALTATAHPHNGKVNSNVHVASRGINLDDYRLPLISEYSDAPTSSSNATIAATVKRGSNYIETATELVKKVAPNAEFRLVDDSYVGTNGIAHVNFRQTANGLDIDNADFNVNVASDGSIFSFGNSFFSGSIPALSRRDASEPEAALKGAISTLNLPIEVGNASAEKTSEELYVIKGTSGAEKDPEAKLVYIQRSDGTLALTWRVETDIMDNWLLTYVDASTNTEIHGVVDYVTDLAQYRVYPWGQNDPSQGDRVLQTDPWSINASPFTWLGDGSSNSTTTSGNNAMAQNNPSGGNQWKNNYRPVAADRKFDFDFDLSMTDPEKYQDASITQLFYTANKYHDLLYQLGFTEPAGNFQVNNNNKGGRSNDAVILNTQDGSGTNNANFATPPDGQNPRMRMYVWTMSTPERDSSFDASVVIHEFTHGLSTRLTGGPANSGCLNTYESGGMGEGWGDFMATALRVKKTDTRSVDFPMGEWIANDPAGIRSYLYSTSLNTNPYTYQSVDNLWYYGVHSIGTAWATMLYDVMWNLIEKHGHPAALDPVFDNSGVPTDGKYLAMKLVLDGMALQPCNPNFVSARDAILDADRALTGGANLCELWTAFAKRGLGEKAKYNMYSRTESFAVPKGVC